MAGPRADSQEQRSVAFGRALRRLREERRMSLRAVGDLLPMSDSNLSRIERGLQSPPGDEVIERLAAVLHGDSAELLRAAGRVAGESDFEQFVRTTLGVVLEDLEEIRATVRNRRAG
ncbi:MAG TPA: helix-turn-helix transcriptional regulator [Solirubrobacterales bacterium]|jgi:transcriptional regulator with XRE-family HTH domain|nr:helix-turn-helix transcriptional regulator [Solirubrobacterales bacterium]